MTDAPFPVISVPPEVWGIIDVLERAGFETWCVGGAIRDALFGEPGLDFDLTTSARPDDVMGLFRRTVPVGVEHGTVAVLDECGTPHEVTTFRKDVRTDGRHAEVEFGVSLEEDLARRDFTMNAIAYHPPSERWADPFDGRRDIEQHVLRAVGDPVRRFQEDFLRILRGLRLSARFEAAIDPATKAAMIAEIEGIRSLSAERVRDEWYKGLRTAVKMGAFIDSWRAVGALDIWLPEIGTLEGVDRLSPDPVFVTAAVASNPGEVLSRLKASRVEIERARAIARHREEGMPCGTDLVAVRRWLARVGERADDLLALDGSSDLVVAAQRVRDAGDPLEVGDLAVTGHDVMAAGFQGPAVGDVLRRLMDEVLEQPGRNSREYLESRIAAWRDDRG